MSYYYTLRAQVEGFQHDWKNKLAEATDEQYAEYIKGVLAGWDLELEWIEKVFGHLR